MFGPLGMRVTRFRDDLTVPVGGIATGYMPSPDGGWRRLDISEETVGDGGIVTSLRGLAPWQDFMLTGAVLGADVRDELLAPAVLADGRRLMYGLGLQIAAIGGNTVYMHSGSIGGFRSVLAYLIDRRLGVAVLANRDDTFPAEIAMRAIERLIGVDILSSPTRLDRSAAIAAQPTVAGLWYSPELDTHMAIDATPDGTVNCSERGYSYPYVALSDGSWLGLGSASSTRLRPAGQDLMCEPVVGDAPPEVYMRTGEPPRVASPTGTYFSEELRAYADLAIADGGAPGTAAITVGLAEPRIVSPVTDSVWAGEGLTIRLLARETVLEISLYAARRCRFTRVDCSPPPRQRGL
jgi:hypothetical protein